jgi:hypothetical protein
MKALSKAGLLFAVALLASAALAVSAQAQVMIHPNDSDVFGEAANPTLDYQGTIISCGTGTATGRTGTDLDFVNLELEFFDGCGIAGLGATVTCSDASGTQNEFGTARLQALDAATDQGTVDRLNEGFLCEVVVAGICTVTVAEQELPVEGGISEADLVGAGTADPTIPAAVDVNATRTGSSLCGPSAGVGGFDGEYHVDPDDIAID